jgi:hypothetical protein
VINWRGGVDATQATQKVLPINKIIWLKKIVQLCGPEKKIYIGIIYMQIISATHLFGTFFENQIQDVANG